jgi:hypothetical protein
LAGKQSTPTHFIGVLPFAEHCLLLLLLLLL